jgi:hypothetical protein
MFYSFKGKDTEVYVNGTVLSLSKGAVSVLCSQEADCWLEVSMLPEYSATSHLDKPFRGFSLY